MELLPNSIHFISMEKKSRALFIILLLAQIICTFTFWQSKREFIYFFPIVGIYSILHFWMYKHQTFSKKSILYITIPFHFAFAFTTPFLSDDVYRYLWDGLVSSSGFNPYLYSPENFPLEAIKRSYNYFSLINHKQLSTLYLPFPELVFLISSYISPTILVYKLITFCFLLVSLQFIIKLDQFYKLNNKLLFVFALHPLIMYEISSSAHLDSIYLTFVLGSIYYTKIIKSKLSNIFLVLSSLARPISVLYFVYLKEKRFLSLLILISLFIFYFYISHIPESGLNAYSSNWHFNHLFFENFRHLFMSLYNEINSYVSYTFFLKIVSAIFVLIIAYKVKISKLEEFILLIHLTFTFVSPTIYPWYFLVVLPLSVILKKDSILIFLYTIMLSYWVLIDYFNQNIWKESLFIIAFEYGIPFLYFLLKEIKSSKNFPKIKVP